MKLGAKLSPKIGIALRKALRHHSWNAETDQAAYIKNPHVVFDVGANVGQTTARYRAMFPEARIFAFEPARETFAVIQSKFGHDKMVHLSQIALSDSDGEVPMFLQAGDEENQQNSLLKPAGDWIQTKGTELVTTRTLDSFCSQNGIDSIDLLKVDVEGSELAVFNGGLGMFKKGAIRAVFTEVFFHPAYSGMPLFCDLDGKLRELGFILHGLYSLAPAANGHLLFGNALYLQP